MDQNINKLASFLDKNLPVEIKGYLSEMIGIDQVLHEIATNVLSDKDWYFAINRYRIYNLTFITNDDGLNIIRVYYAHSSINPDLEIEYI